MSFFVTKYITYVYDATGAKLEKKVIDGSTTTTTQYDGGYVYKDGGLQYFPHAEGYVNITAIASNGSTSQYARFEYIYQYKDHLGNIRLSYLKNADTDSLQVVEESNYYAFGMLHKGYNNAVTGLGNASAQKYKYNGKELQDELGLNMYDYGARNYDPAIGRWMNIDPLAEKRYENNPYMYANNNPVIFIDPDGMDFTLHGSDAQDFARGMQMALNDLDEGGGGGGDKKKPKKDENALQRLRKDNLLKRTRKITKEWFADAREAVDDFLKPVREEVAKTRKAFSELRESNSEILHEELGPLYELYGQLGGSTANSLLAGRKLYSSALGFTIDPNKFNYFFGRVASSAHNAERSAQNLKDLTTLGIKSESQLMNVFNKAFKSGTTVQTRVSEYGTTITRSVNVGNKGSVNVGFFYQGSNMNATPSVSTIIPKIFK